MIYTRDILTDSLKFGTMFVVAQYLTGGSLRDVSWQKSSLFTILGFAAYQLSVRHLDLGVSGVAKLVTDDILKNGVMLIVSRLLSGGSLTDKTWIYSSIAMLVGFVVYDVVVSRYVQGRDLSYNSGVQGTIDDVAKFGTMFIVSQLINGGSITDQKWMTASAASLAGFAAYQLGTSRLL